MRGLLLSFVITLVLATSAVAAPPGGRAPRQARSPLERMDRVASARHRALRVAEPRNRLRRPTLTLPRGLRPIRAAAKELAADLSRLAHFEGRLPNAYRNAVRQVEGNGHTPFAMLLMLPSGRALVVGPDGSFGALDMTVLDRGVGYIKPPPTAVMHVKPIEPRDLLGVRLADVQKALSQVHETLRAPRSAAEPIRIFWAHPIAAPVEPAPQPQSSMKAVGGPVAKSP